MVDYEAGRIERMPDWVGVMYAAKWMKVAPWELIEQDDIWTEWARLLMRIEQTGQERASRKGGKG